MKQQILKLNQNFQAIEAASWKNIMTGLASGAMYPVDVSYFQNSDGVTDLSQVESLNVVKSFEEWMDLPVRPYDEYVNCPNRVIRIPPVVVCSKYDKIYHKKRLFPTKNNIWKRDNYICAYSGVKLDKERLSVDHLVPKSRGGKNTWDNLVTCDKKINVFKGNRTPKEAGLVLLYKPYKPDNGMIFDDLREEWSIFLDSTLYS